MRICSLTICRQKQTCRSGRRFYAWYVSSTCPVLLATLMRWHIALDAISRPVTSPPQHFAVTVPDTPFPFSFGAAALLRPPTRTTTRHMACSIGTLCQSATFNISGIVQNGYLDLPAGIYVLPPPPRAIIRLEVMCSVRAPSTTTTMYPLASV